MRKKKNKKKKNPIKRWLRGIISRSERMQKLIKKLYAKAFPAEGTHSESGIYKKIVKKLYKIYSQEIAKQNVIYPQVKESLYNKRINNYLMEKELGHTFRRWVVEQMYYSTVGRFPNIDKPSGLNEKMQWMREHYHDPLMTKCVDKCSFKEYVKETVGEEYVVPLYGVWTDVNDIDFDALPDSYILKSTWGWGDLQNIIVKDKASLDRGKARAMISNWMMPWNNYYYQSFEWDSKDIPPRILAEKLLVPESGEIVDYKLYCYNGKCRHFLVCKDRKTKTKYINYDLDFNCIKLSPNSTVVDEKFEDVEMFCKVKELAEKLAKPFPLVRVDFYYIDGKIYVGELTFSPGGGFNTYYEEWDKRLGDMLILPKANVDEIK